MNFFQISSAHCAQAQGNFSDNSPSWHAGNFLSRSVDFLRILHRVNKGREGFFCPPTKNLSENLVGGPRNTWFDKPN